MSDEVLVHESRIAVPYSWSAGLTLSRFFKSMRDEKKLYATRCAKCAKTYMPARGSCPGCLAQLEDFVEVGPRGTLVTFTQALYATAAQPESVRGRPIYGLIKLDGADTAFLHLLEEGALAGYKAGQRVEPVWAENRTGTMHDILYFRRAD